MQSVTTYKGVMDRAKKEGKVLDPLSVCFTLGFIAGTAAAKRESCAALPMVGVGCWSFGSKTGEYWGERNQTDIDAIVLHALKSGHRILFDTAEAYNAGRSEECLAKALSRVGDAALLKNAVLTSKILPNNCGNVRSHLEATLRRLNRTSIELYQVHWPLPKNGPSAKAVFSELATLQKEGKIRHIGVSNFGIKQMQEAMATGVKIATNQLCYNLLTRSIEFEVLPFCREHGIGVIAYSPLLQGHITDKGASVSSFDDVDPHRCRTRHFAGSRKMSRHEGPGHEDLLMKTLRDLKGIAEKSKVPLSKLALAWTAARAPVVSVIPGARNVAQLQANIDALTMQLDDKTLKELDDATDALKKAMGGALDIYESDAKQRSY